MYIDGAVALTIYIVVDVVVGSVRFDSVALNPVCRRGVRCYLLGICNWLALGLIVVCVVYTLQTILSIVWIIIMISHADHIQMKSHW